LPQFHRDHSGRLNITDSTDAKAFSSKLSPWERVQNPEDVCSHARHTAIRLGGDRQHVLGQHTLQFGKFRDCTFKWVLENALGYAGYIVCGMEFDRPPTPKEKTRHANNEAFQEYVQSFSEDREALSLKKVQHQQQVQQKKLRAEVTRMLSSKELSKTDIKRRLKKVHSPRKQGIFLFKVDLKFPFASFELCT